MSFEFAGARDVARLSSAATQPPDKGSALSGGVKDFYSLWRRHSLGRGLASPSASVRFQTVQRKTSGQPQLLKYAKCKLNKYSKNQTKEKKNDLII